MEATNMSIEKKPKLLYNNTGSELLTTEELAEYLNVKVSYIYQLTHVKRIPFIKMGAKLRFRRDDIDKWLKSQEVKNGDNKADQQDWVRLVSGYIPARRKAIPKNSRNTKRSRSS